MGDSCTCCWWSMDQSGLLSAVTNLRMSFNYNLALQCYKAAESYTTVLVLQQYILQPPNMFHGHSDELYSYNETMNSVKKKLLYFRTTTFHLWRYPAESSPASQAIMSLWSRQPSRPHLLIMFNLRTGSVTSDCSIIRNAVTCSAVTLVIC